MVRLFQSGWKRQWDNETQERRWSLPVIMCKTFKRKRRCLVCAWKVWESYKKIPKCIVSWKIEIWPDFLNQSATLKVVDNNNEIMRPEITQICQFWPNKNIWARILARQIWSSGVSLKRSCKMQFRRLGLRSIGPSSQKLWPNFIFGRLPHFDYNVKHQSGGPNRFMGL